MLACACLLPSTIVRAQPVMENLGRNVVVVRSGETSAYVGWRLLGTDPDGGSADNTSLRIYTTTIPAVNRLFTLMHDRTYRLAIAWQNVGYNQPPHPGFFLGSGMAPPARPRIEVPKR